MINRENRNKCIVVIGVLLLFFGLIFTGVKVSYADKKSNSDIVVKLDQLYSSDYELNNFDNKYFIGSYEDNKIDVIIDENGSEILKNIDNIYYDGIYKMKDDRYLIYNNRNNNLNTYIFDGEKIEHFYEIKEVSYVKPVLYKGIDREYIIGFVSMVDNNLYIYGLNSTGIVVLNNTLIVGDDFTNNVYYSYNENNIVVKNDKDLFGVVSLTGEVIIDFIYKDIINSNNDTFIALNQDDLYGIVDKNNNELVKFKYNVIDQYDNYFLFVNKDNKMALYDSSYNKIVDYVMEYNTLLKYDLRSNIRSINLYKVNGKIAIVNNYLEDVNGTEYDKHSVYIIDGNTVIKEIEEIGFGYDNIVYTYDNKYNISIYNGDVSLLCDISLEDVNKINSIISVSNEIIKIEYVNKDNKIVNEYYDLKGNKNDFKLGSLYFKDIDYKGYIKKSKGEYILSIYDFENILLTQIKGKKINKFNNYLIVDHGIYRINRLEN